MLNYKLLLFGGLLALTVGRMPLAVMNLELGNFEFDNDNEFDSGDDEAAMNCENCHSNRTWADVGACQEHKDQICQLKFPQTTLAQRKCYINATIADAFKKAGTAFIACVDQKLHTGDKCLVVGRRHHRYHAQQMIGEEMTMEEAMDNQVKGTAADKPHPRPYPHPRPQHPSLSPYSFCQSVETYECNYGCRRLRGRNAFKFLGCAKSSFEDAVKLFLNCVRQRGEDGEDAGFSEDE